MRGILFGMAWAFGVCYVALASDNPLGKFTHLIFTLLTTR